GWIALGLVSGVGAVSHAGRLEAYPGGTPGFVTNAGPYCAVCHSSASSEQVRERPAEAAANLLPEKRHYASIAAGEENYNKLDAEGRQKLLAAVKAMDANSHVTLAASAMRVKRLAPLTVTVTTRGGAGPVVGV